MDRSSRPPKAPPTPPSDSRTIAGGRPRVDATWIWSRCSHCAGDVEVDAAVAVGDGEPRLGTEERRVLRADLEVRLDDDVGSPARLVRVTVADAHVAHEVAAGMHGTAVAGEGELGVDDGLQFLVHHDDLVEGTTGDLGMVGGDDGHGLALVADLVEGEHGLIGDLHAVRLLAGDVLVGEHRGHTRDRQRPRRVQAEDAGAWEGAAQRGAPAARRTGGGRRSRRSCR